MPPMGKVQRLSGSGLRGRVAPRLKIESGPPERVLWEERLNQPRAQRASRYSSVSTGGNHRGEPAEGSLNRSNPPWYPTSPSPPSAPASSEVGRRWWASVPWLGLCRSFRSGGRGSPRSTPPLFLRVVGWAWVCRVGNLYPTQHTPNHNLL